MEPGTLPPSDGSHSARGDDCEPTPGIVVVFTGGLPAAHVITLSAGSLELGRGEVSPGRLDDGRISRRHALIVSNGGRCMVTDLGSQNGTYVDGVLAYPHQPTRAQRVIRIGDSLLLPCADVGPLERTGLRTINGFVRGATMQALVADVERAAASGTTLHIRGESGTGKEGIAQVFHSGGARAAGALIAVNCAAIPPAIAERLLFGAKRGAYSGADADATGYIHEADGGTLFLDEIGELDLQVQAKLLRVLESGELLPLGASKPRKVVFTLCSATNRDLRALVAAGTLREDLYFRIAHPGVMLPALRNRPEEIPALIAYALSKLSPAPTAHVSLVEQCLLRAWPGNVRELLSEVRSAAQRAHATLADDPRVTARHLPVNAGSAFGSTIPEPLPALEPRSTNHSSSSSSSELPRKRTPQVDDQWRRRIEDALRANAGNIAATARGLGLHRTQLRRLVKRHEIAVGIDDDGIDD